MQLRLENEMTHEDYIKTVGRPDTVPYIAASGCRCCATCKRWNKEMVIDGYAICRKLVYLRNNWKLKTFLEAQSGNTSMVRTHQDFLCGYWKSK